MEDFRELNSKRNKESNGLIQGSSGAHNHGSDMVTMDRPKTSETHKFWDRFGETLFWPFQKKVGFDEKYY